MGSEMCIRDRVWHLDAPKRCTSCVRSRKLQRKPASRCQTPLQLTADMIGFPMKTATDLTLSALVREQINRPSPIRQIMKMAERQNILAMGLDPAQVISFGGGWVNHSAPDEFRQAYESIVADADLFHKSGGYTATLGDMECREQIARFEEHLFGVPRLGPEHIAIGMGLSLIHI